MRFMHIADVHLGARPDVGAPWSGDRGKELWQTFEKCIGEARARKVDLLLIAGDLFHRQPRGRELQEVNTLFSSLSGTIVVLMAGNHDYLKPSSPYWDFPWGENVVCLFDDQCEKIRLPELRTEIYGFSYHQQEITAPLYDALQAGKGDYFKILLAHGGDAQHIPMNKEKLMKAGFDYIALGHIHKPQVYIKNLALYAGALEPIDINDTGPHGFVLGETFRKKVKLTFVELAGRQYRHEEIEVTPEDTSFSLKNKIEERIRREGSQHLYKVILRGQRDPQFLPDCSLYRKCGRILEIQDRTVPAFPLEELKRRYQGQLVGEFIESFGEEPREAVERKALQYGLEALLADLR